MKQNFDKQSDKKPDKLTQPAIYPDTRYKDSKAANPSDENVDRAREWSEIIRL